MKEEVHEREGAVLLLKIQDENDVKQGLKILRGELPCKYQVIQFCYDEYNRAKIAYPLFEIAILKFGRRLTREEAKRAIGSKGDAAVMSAIAPALETFSTPGVHVRFVYCNLSEAAVIRLAEAVERNGTLKGFSCFDNPCNYPDGENYDPNTRADKRVRQALIETNAPIKIWNNEPLPDDIKAARTAKAGPQHKAPKATSQEPNAGRRHEASRVTSQQPNAGWRHEAPKVTSQPPAASVRTKAPVEDDKMQIVLAELRKSDLDADDQVTYAKVLVEAGYSSVVLIKRLDETKLKKIGISKPAHIEVILDMVTALNTNFLAARLESVKLAKTVMISYQWDSQALAFRVRDFLERREIRVIIDRGGIKGDFLQWMADSVKISNPIFLIITEKYAESKSCRLEANFAHENNKRIVPLVGERGYTGGGGWLSLLISGKIRYDLVDNFEGNMATIVERELD